MRDGQREQEMDAYRFAFFFFVRESVKYWSSERFVREKRSCAV